MKNYWFVKVGFQNHGFYNITVMFIVTPCGKAASLHKCVTLRQADLHTFGKQCRTTLGKLVLTASGKGGKAVSGKLVMV